MKIQTPVLICGVRKNEWTKDGKSHAMTFLDWYADEAHSSVIDDETANEYGQYRGQYVNAAFELSEYKGQVRYKVLAIRPQTHAK